MRVRHASPPHRMARSSSPRWISSAVPFTNVCGLLPPMVVAAVSRGVRPSWFATTHAGSPYFQLSSPTTRTESGLGTAASPASVAAARTASHIKAEGSRASSRPVARWMNWPAPMSTGVRGSSDIVPG
ncbi:MAG: hypothetical protein IPP16_00825 [Acidimicrobiaceae bacterium]|nr:hypothetical protein [Acidimicrobiaceae bacterium]